MKTNDSTAPVMNRAALYQIITESERWATSVSTSDSETQQAWRSGFAAGMHRMEIYAGPIIDPPAEEATEETS